MGEVLCVCDKDLSAAGGVGQGTLRPTDRQRDTLIFRNVLRRAMVLQSHFTVAFIIIGHRFLDTRK